MYWHGSNCLDDPISRMSSWWSRTTAGVQHATIRHELVRHVRQEIAAGLYDTPERWEAALETLFRRLEDGG
jgi:hypothetical protein